MIAPQRQSYLNAEEGSVWILFDLHTPGIEESMHESAALWRRLWDVENEMLTPDHVIIAASPPDPARDPAKRARWEASGTSV